MSNLDERQLLAFFTDWGDRWKGGELRRDRELKESICNLEKEGQNEKNSNNHINSRFFSTRFKS